jgi:hypothetical protein
LVRQHLYCLRPTDPKICFNCISADNFEPAYAVWFDYKRQSDPEFRKALKRSNRRMARAVREENEAQGALQREAIRKALARAKDEGFPTDLEEKEAFFMGQVAQGESLSSEGMSAFYRAFVSYKHIHIYIHHVSVFVSFYSSCFTCHHRLLAC